MAARFGGATLADDRGFRFRSGLASGFMNGVLLTSVATGGVAALVADVRSWFPPGLHWTWETSALDRPTDLPARLSAAGFSHLAVLPAMTLPLADFVPRPAPAVDVSEVRDASDLSAWLAVRDANHPLDAATRAAWLATEGDPALHQFVARSFDGNPVGSLSLFVDGETAGLYHVDVIPSARGQGVGTAMSTAALNVAINAGARLAVLTATELGAHLYRRLGFEVVPSGAMDSWIHHGGSSP